jgi:hypothetical protein
MPNGDIQMDRPLVGAKSPSTVFMSDPFIVSSGSPVCVIITIKPKQGVTGAHDLASMRRRHPGVCLEALFNYRS